MSEYGEHDRAQDENRVNHLMASLEQRWDAMAQMIRGLREENGRIAEELRQRDETLGHLRGELDHANRELHAAREEKGQNMARMENILARHRDLES